MAYDEQCPEAEHCTPSVVILSLEGHRLDSFHVRLSRSPQSLCLSILGIGWIGDQKIGAECHLNPSLDEYMVIDLLTNHTTDDLFGYGFTPSPDGKAIAHVGWIPHFAPPFAQSNYLQIERTIVYPLPKGLKPFALKDAEPPPQVVKQAGLTFSGIHEFGFGPVWSPDSQKLALIDCIYDWRANSIDSSSAGDGQESGRKCSALAVTRRGRITVLPLDHPPTDANIEWADATHMSVEVEGLKRAVEVK